MIQARPHNLTFEDYLIYDDDTDRRYELADGELVEMPEPSPQHSDIAEFLYDAFKAEVKRLQLDWKVKLGGHRRSDGHQQFSDSRHCDRDGQRVAATPGIERFSSLASATTTRC